MNIGAAQSEKWKQIKDVLMDTLDLDPPLRADYLDKQRVSSEIRSEVESFLEIELTTDGILEASALELSKDFFADPNEEFSLAGMTIGHYTLVSELGLGGMGAVYLARRNDGRFEQQVAVKLLKREFNVGKMRDSFKREIEIQAKLTHPNIATILDTGATDDGIPYIVMEYVEGLPIDKYCRQHNLGLIERLKLFNKACEAIGFAHQNLIVHRDLKPSNILVSPDGVPKLLDFGISKPLDSGQYNEAGITIIGAMTPEYASPEQIEGGRITTATDIYSLGVVLFKLLTGTYPYDFSKKTNGHNLREITAEDPILPSHVSDTKSSIERSRLKGDIDNIVLKAISKEPENRYSTVKQFSEDIWRYIDGEPVTARPATFSYRLNKFYKRNRLGVTAAVLIFAALVAGVSVALWQTRVARANAAVAVAESDNAKDEQKKAEKISSFMMKIFRYANPKWYAEGYSSGGEARVIDALDSLAPKIDTEFADQPDVLAEMHHHFGDAYMARAEPGGAEKARTHFQRAFELRRSYYGDWHEFLAKDMLYLYFVQKPPRPEESVKMLSDAIVMMRATNPKNLNLPYMLEDYFHRMSDDEFAAIHDMFLRNVPQPAPHDKYLAADQLFDEMLGLLRLHFAEDSGQVVHQKCAGMTLKFRIGKTAEADEFYKACKQMHEAVPTSDNTKVDPASVKRLADFRKLTGIEDQ